MKRLAAMVRQLLVFFMLLLSFSLVWCINNFGNIGLSEIVFTLNMPLKGTANSYFVSYFLLAFLPAAVFWGIELLLKCFPKKRTYSQRKTKSDFYIYRVCGNLLYGQGKRRAFG